MRCSEYKVNDSKNSVLWNVKSNLVRNTVSSVLKYEVQLLLASVVQCTVGIQNNLKSRNLHLRKQPMKSLFLSILRVAAIERITVIEYRRHTGIHTSPCFVQF